MKTNHEGRIRRRHSRGTSLIEVVIAVGVLAVAVPLVLGAMAQTGGVNLSAQAETRSSWIVPTCMDELGLAMKGRSQYLDPLTPGRDFPTSGDLALAFSSEGAVLGKVNQSDYEGGIQMVGGVPVRYLVAMSGVMPGETSGNLPPTLMVRIAMEYPASAPAAKRQKIEFHTCLP